MAVSAACLTSGVAPSSPATWPSRPRALGSYDEESGEPFFAVDVGESYEVSDAHLRFVARDGGRYLIELSGTVSAAVLGRPERFELLAWADELPDHAHGV